MVMFPHKGLLLTLVLLALQVSTPPVRAQDSIEVGQFSLAQEGDAPAPDWEPLYFRKIPAHTVYSLVKDADTTVVKAVSNAAASGLTRKISIDPKQYPVIEWRWKVDNVIQKSDVGRKAGDDYAARIYITFAYDADKIALGRKIRYKTAKLLFGGDTPAGALNYIWENKTAKDTLADNPYTDFVKMIVIENVSSPAGEWVVERRNVYEDYRRAFDEEPPLISGIAIMTDTDNTAESATAYYGDIVFKSQAQ